MNPGSSATCDRAIVGDILMFAQFNGKLTEDDVAENPDFTIEGMKWLKANYPHRHDFLDSVYEQGKSKGAISRKQAAGVLNCMVAQLRREKPQTYSKAERDELEAELFPAKPVSSIVPKIPAEGFYTVIFGDDEDDYVTLRVDSADWAGNIPVGSKTLKYLLGPDNTNDYKGFAFLCPTQASKSGVEIRMWGSYRQNLRLETASRALIQDAEVAGKAFAEHSGRCRRCYRVLTVPTSLHSGYGPECRNKI